MENPTKKGGSAWRCMLPIVVYILLQGVCSAAVVMLYYMKKGLWKVMESGSSTALSQVLDATKGDMVQLTYFSMLVGYLVLIPVFAWMIHRDRIRNHYKEQLAGGIQLAYTYSSFLYLVFGGAASCLASSNMIAMSGLTQASDSYTSTVDVLFSTGVGWEILGIGILAPLTEELLFRGLVYNRLKEFSPVVMSAVWASLIFALLHGNLVQGIYGFVMGCLFCYVYERYDSLLAPIILHISSNMVAIVGSETGILDFMYTGPVAFYASTFLCCLLVVFMIYLIERYIRPITDLCKPGYAERAGLRTLTLSNLDELDLTDEEREILRARLMQEEEQKDLPDEQSDLTDEQSDLPDDDKDKNK